VAVVDRHSQSVLQAGDDVRPGLVAGSADLRPVAGLAGPPLLQPRQVVAFNNIPDRQLGGQVAGYAVLVPLHEVTRDVVEPLVGDHQTGQGVGEFVVQLDIQDIQALGAQYLAQFAGAGADVHDLVGTDRPGEAGECLTEQG